MKPRESKSRSLYLTALAAHAVLLACMLGACDERREVPVPAPSVSQAACLAALDPAPTVPVCTADSSAHSGANVICSKVNSDAPTTWVGTLPEPASSTAAGRVFASFSPTTQLTSLGMNKGASGVAPDAIGLLVEGQGTGLHNLAIFTSWTSTTGTTGIGTAFIGSEEGCGKTAVTTYGAVSSGRIQGTFDTTLCHYNDSIHLVQCNLGQMRLQGAYDIARTADTP